MKLVVTGLGWIGPEAGSVLNAARKLLSNAKKEILIVAYTITHGVKEFLELLEETLQRGVHVYLIINKLDTQNIRMELKRMNKIYSHFSLYDFVPKTNDEELHAKLIIVDRKQALLGSANFSKRGFVTNHEIGIIVDREVAECAAILFTKLRCDSRVIEVN